MSSEKKRWDYGGYLWSGRQGVMQIPDGQNPLILESHCRTPDIEQDQVQVIVSRGQTFLDRITFTANNQTVQKTYDLATEKPGVQPGNNLINISVSRTWVPHEHLQNFDRRRLGIGVKILQN